MITEPTNLEIHGTENPQDLAPEIDWENNSVELCVCGELYCLDSYSHTTRGV